MPVFIETLEALFPLYALMSVGALLRKTKVIEGALIKELNKILFRALLPASLFISVYDADLHMDENWGALVFAGGSIVLLFIILMLIVPRFEQSRPAAATMIQGLYRSNFVLLGLAYTVQLYGEKNVGATGLLIALVVPLFNALAVVDFEIMRGERPRLWEILKRVLKNPLIIATFLALLLRLTGLRLPSLLYKPVDMLSQSASPVAMIIIGASLTVKSLKGNWARIRVVVLGRLILIPLIFMTAAVLLGFRDVLLIAFLTIFGGPAAVSSQSMAYELGGDGPLAGQIVAATTIGSLLTMFLFIVALKAMGFC